MADLVHDASGPASSEPAGIALQQASRPVSSDRAKLSRVFISYSRDDLNFADQLEAALTLCGFECLIDRHDISGGEEWKRRLGNLISEVDTVIFVLSPSSAGSPTCNWEVEEAARLNKRRSGGSAIKRAAEAACSDDCSTRKRHEHHCPAMASNG
jgi:hypothetical protein